jgi:hypothetical protein
VACSSGKRTYLSRAEAKQQARRFHSSGRTMARPYRCPECREWHLTTADANGRAFHRRGRTDQ